MSGVIPPDEAHDPGAGVPLYPNEGLGFPNVIEAEAEEIDKQERLCETIRQSIAMADGLLGMAGSAHYQQFVQAVRDVQTSRMQELLTASTDREANVLSGRCLQLGDILTMVTKTQNNRAALAVALEQAEDRLDQLINPQKRTFLS